MEGDNVSNAILSTIKTKQVLSLICLNLHFELA